MKENNREGSQSHLLLSACLIVKNEERMLPDCLASIRAAADEIVVVDTGSNDATRSIVQAAGCILIDAAWQDDFSQARNIALAQATGEWILSIDADERLLNPEILRQTLLSTSPATGGLLAQLHSRVRRADNSTDAYELSVARIFRNRPAIRFSGVIHEQIWDAVLQAGFVFERSPISIEHLGYDLPADQIRLKQQRNLYLLEKMLALAPSDGYALFQRGKTHMALGEREAALRDFQQALSVQGSAQSVCLQALNYIAILRYQNGEYSEALRCAQESATLSEGQTFAYFVLGETYTAMSIFDKALDAYQRMRMNYGVNDALANIAGQYFLPSEQLAFRIGRSYVGLGHWGKAFEEFRKGLAQNPNDVACLVGLANVELRQNNKQEALRLLRKANELDPGRQDLRDVLARTEQDLESHPTGASMPHSVEDANAPLISGAIIVGSDITGLDRAIASLRMFCDEVIVANTRSADNVDYLASALGAQTIEAPWQDDYAQARNDVIAQCSGVWIAMLDSDEAIDEETASKIKEAIDAAQSDVGGIITGIRHTTDSGATFTEVLRIFRNAPGIRYEGFVHEQITQSVARAGLTIMRRIDIVLEHFPSPPTPEKNERYRRLLEKEVTRQGADSETALFQLALLLFNFDAERREQEALNALQKYLAHPLVRGDNAAVLLNSYCRWLLERSDYAALQKSAIRSAEYHPEQREAWRYRLLAAAHFGDEDELQRSLTTLAALYDPATSYESGLAFEKDADVEEAVKLGLAASLESARSELHVAAAHFALSADAKDLVMQYAIAACRRNAYHAAAVWFSKTFDSAERFPESIALMHAAAQASGYKPLQALLGQTPQSQNHKPLLTLSMIVKDEEKYLPGCLESVRGIADEIVIADTGSSDATLDIARRFGARIIQIPWTNDFAAARNAALEASTGQWILYLDADERLENAENPDIRSLIDNADETIGAFVCTISSRHRQNEGSAETHTGGYPRLFRNLGYPRVKFSGRVHEQISPSLIELGKTLAPSEIAIRHLGYDIEPDEMRRKITRNYRLLLEHVKEEPENAYAWFQLGQTLALMQLNTEAREALEFSIQLGALPAHIAASAACSLAQLAGGVKDFEKALQMAEYSIQQAPGQIYARHLRAFALLHLQRWSEAERAFHDVLQQFDRKLFTPNAGYDVLVPRELVEKGLEMAQTQQIA